MRLLQMNVVWTRKGESCRVVAIAFLVFSVILYVKLKFFSCMQPKTTPTENSLEDYLGLMESIREWISQFGNKYLGISGVWEARIPTTPRAVRSQSYHMDRMKTQSFHLFVFC